MNNETEAKKKAKELVEKFTKHFYGFGIDQDVRIKEAKECALICVDEILKAAKITGLGYEKAWKYWEAVKVEIENK